MHDYPDAISLWSQSKGIGLSRADDFEAIQNYLQRNPGMSFVARDQDKLVGAVLCGHDGRRGFLHHLAVDPAYRRQGIGKQLAELCITVLRQAGIEKCHLFVYSENERGLAFWQKLGWRVRDDLELLTREIS
ncbi:MAG: GNAT family N-acetyltransferase [Anaerolineaceae bacterium]|nr:GNAT family N-acetyltransferase [Anaerolineaceae bacterium]